MAAPSSLPCAEDWTEAINFEISRPLKPTVFFATSLKCSSVTPLTGTGRSGILPNPSVFIMPPRNVLDGCSSPGSAPRTMSLSKYCFTKRKRVSSSGNANSMVSSTRSKTAESKSSGRFVAITKVTSLLISPVLYNNAFNADLVSCEATFPPLFAKNASASSMNNNKPLREVPAQSNIS